jgi:hypothetical protein
MDAGNGVRRAWQSISRYEERTGGAARLKLISGETFPCGWISAKSIEPRRSAGDALHRFRDSFGKLLRIFSEVMMIVSPGCLSIALHEWQFLREIRESGNVI